MRLVSAFALCLLSGCYAAHDLEGAPTAPFEACFVAKQRECGGEVNDDCGV